MDTTLIINRVLPILFLLGLGYWMRRQAFITASTIDDLRKIVVNIALPSALFLNFLHIDLELKFLLLFVTLYLLCIGLFYLGGEAKTRLKVKREREYFPFMITGFEFGMLGIGLFGSAYGDTGYIALTDLGHELFIWSFFLALLLMRRDGVRETSQLVRAVLQSPVMIAIILGIALNILGAQDFLYDKPITGGIMSTLGILAGLTSPLILIIIGYGLRLADIRLDVRHPDDTLKVILLRLSILIPLALVLNLVLIRGILGLEEGYEAALFTLLILPPPFIIPLYMRRDAPPSEREYVNNTLMLHTVVSIVIFIVYFSLNPTI